MNTNKKELKRLKSVSKQRREEKLDGEKVETMPVIRLWTPKQAPAACWDINTCKCFD